MGEDTPTKSGIEALPLTDAKIKALKPRGKPYKITDYDGLFLFVTPSSGSKLWRFKFRLNGKEGLMCFGKYPFVSLMEARFKRDEAKSMVAKGINPAHEKRKAKDAKAHKTEHTFAKIAEKYLTKAIKEGKSEATLKKKEWVLRFAMDDFGDLPMNEITAQVVLATLKKREKLGHYETARRMRATIGGVFRFAVASGVAQTDPTFALKDALIRPIVKHRAAITDKAKLAELMHALENYGGKAETRIALKLLILFVRLHMKTDILAAVIVVV